MMMLMQKWCKCAWAITVSLGYIRTNWVQTNSNQHQLSAESLKNEAGRHLSRSLSLSPSTTESDLLTTFSAYEEQLFIFHFVADFVCYRTVTASILTLSWLNQDCYCLSPQSSLFWAPPVLGLLIQVMFSRPLTFVVILAAWPVNLFWGAVPKTGHASALRRY